MEATFFEADIADDGVDDVSDDDEVGEVPELGADGGAGDGIALNGMVRIKKRG